MPQVTRLRVAAAAIAAGALTLGTLVSATAAQAANPRRAIADSHPTWAVAAKRLSSKAVTSGTVNARVYLAPSHQAELAGDVAAVSSPASKSYRHFWTTAAVRKEFAPSAAEVASVKSWLTSAGLSVTKTDAKYPAGAYVGVRGSVAAASKAFGVTFGTYRGPGGQSDRAPEPGGHRALVRRQLSPRGLRPGHREERDQAARCRRPPPNYWVAKPCSTYYGQKIATNKPKAYGKHQPWTNCGYTPSQVRGAYGVTASGMTGKGQTVAIVDAYASPTIKADANQFATVVGDQPFAAGQFKQYKAGPYTLAGPNECDAAGWYGEETLDVESVHGEAPDANVRYVGAGSCEDSDLANAEALIVDNDLASIVSNSYGEPASYSTINATYDLIFQVGALEGIGFFFSSGDSGYEGPGEDPASPHDQVDYPTSSPYVTSVGGTSLAISKTQQLRVGDLLGHPARPAGAPQERRQEVAVHPAGQVPGRVRRLQRRWREHRVPPALLPGGRGARPAWPPAARRHDQQHAHAGGPGRVGARRPEHRDPGRRDRPCSRTGRPTPSRSAGSAAPAWPARRSPASRRTPSRRPVAHLGFANPAIYYLDTHFTYGSSNAAYNDVTDHPLGPGYLAEVRNNYTNPYTKQGPLLTYLRTLGIDGEGADALPRRHGLRRLDRRRLAQELHPGCALAAVASGTASRRGRPAPGPSPPACPGAAGRAGFRCGELAAAGAGAQQAGSAVVRGDLRGRGLAVGAAQPLGQGARLQLVLLRPDRLQDVHREDVAELGGPLQGQAPGHRGQEPRAERVPGPGRVQPSAPPEPPQRKPARRRPARSWLRRARGW